MAVSLPVALKTCQLSSLTCRYVLLFICHLSSKFSNWMQYIFGTAISFDYGRSCLMFCYFLFINILLGAFFLVRSIFQSDSIKKCYSFVDFLDKEIKQMFIYLFISITQNWSHFHGIFTHWFGVTLVFLCILCKVNLLNSFWETINNKSRIYDQLTFLQSPKNNNLFLQF